MGEGRAAGRSEPAVGDRQLRLSNALQHGVEALDGQRPGRIGVQLGEVAPASPGQLVPQDPEDGVGSTACDDARPYPVRLDADGHRGRGPAPHELDAASAGADDIRAAIEEEVQPSRPGRPRRGPSVDIPHAGAAHHRDVDIDAARAELLDQAPQLGRVRAPVGHGRSVPVEHDGLEAPIEGGRQGANGHLRSKEACGVPGWLGRDSLRPRPAQASRLMSSSRARSGASPW